MSHIDTIPPDRWGKDHWLLIAFAFSMTGRPLDVRRMRKDGLRYPTRLRGGDVAPGHNDFDCLADAEAVCLLTNVGTGIQPRCVFTPGGLVLAQWLVGCIDEPALRYDGFALATLTWDEAVTRSGADLPSETPCKAS